MASTPVQFEAPSGLTLTLKLFPHGSDTIANGAGGDAATEKVNMLGLYEATVTEALAGYHNALVVDDSGNPIGAYNVNLADDTTIHRCGDLPSGFDGAKNNLDDLNDITITAGAIADAVLDEAVPGHLTALTVGWYLDQTNTTAVATLQDTAVIGEAGAGLTAVRLASNGLANVTAWTVDVTGNLSGSVGSVTALGAQAKLDVNEECDTAITDAALATAAGVDDLPTVAEFNARTLAAAGYATAAAVTALNNLSSAQAQTAAADALTAYGAYNGTPPTTTQINTALAAAHGSGSWEGAGGGLNAQAVRDAMKLAPTAGAPAAGSVDEHLDDIEATIAGVGGVPGPGADACTQTILDGAGNPVENAQVWVKQSPTGPVYAGTLVTDSNGQVTFMLDAGNTYYLYAQKGGRKSIDGEAFTAEAD